jgi:hypothetical protein
MPAGAPVGHMEPLPAKRPPPPLAAAASYLMVPLEARPAHVGAGSSSRGGGGGSARVAWHEVWRLGLGPLPALAVAAAAAAPTRAAGDRILLTAALQVGLEGFGVGGCVHILHQRPCCGNGLTSSHPEQACPF